MLSHAIARVPNDVVAQISAIRRSDAKGRSGWKTVVRLDQRKDQDMHFADIRFSSLQPT